ncbi:Rossmann fold nucleotide-binding protein Smf possibly involved in DNA uptake [Lachnospiraceae bacterium TWA4]|nr:Rossmann fold nucleotide-binding protein Smf possibly involved in DNA uptake [Lachnospiraceae bacterium TWA4]
MEKIYRYWLSNIEGLGAVSIAKLLAHFGSGYQIFLATEDEFNHLLPKKVKNCLLESKLNFNYYIDSYHKLQEEGIRFITPMDEDYPENLKNIYNPPQGLYIKGHLIKKKVPMVAIVGARNCTYYGKDLAKSIAKSLAEIGVTVVSGLASGIDAQAHIGALEASGVTYGVLGNGVNVCYPRENSRIYQNILTKGCLISEFPVDSPPLALHFPQRNRIISGLADVILVVEARLKSGSLITADLALEQGKDVFAIPGRVHDSLSEGCNSLIKQGAGIYTEINDLLELFHLDTKETTKLSCNQKLGLAFEEEKVYSELGLCSLALSEIVEKSGLDTANVMKILIKLEKKGLVKQTEKNFYMRSIKV